MILPQRIARLKPFRSGIIFVDTFGSDLAVWDDGEWVSWEEQPDEDEVFSSHLAWLEHQAELRIEYPHADLTLIPYFNRLLSLAQSYFRDTGRHLNSYGDIGELFGAITYGIKLHRRYAQGSDGKLGNDFIEIKTITPFKKFDRVMISLDGHFSKLLVVKITEKFEVSGKMIDRSALKTKKKHGNIFVRWNAIGAVETW
jgi:hypothetical protein